MKRGKKGATGPRTKQGKSRSSQNARKHGLLATTIQPSEAQQLEYPFEAFREELQLNGAAELAIGRELSHIELGLRRIRDYETHRFKVADTYGALQNADRRFRKPFEAVFLRRDGGKAPSRRLPAVTAERYLSDLKTRVESHGPQKEIVQTVTNIYGREMDILGATIITRYASFEHVQNTADPETLQELKAEIIESIDLAIATERVRSNMQFVADSVEFADDAPVLAPDTELERIHRYRTQYERQRTRLLNDLIMIRSVKRRRRR